MKGTGGGGFERFLKNDRPRHPSSYRSAASSFTNPVKISYLPSEVSCTFLCILFYEGHYCHGYLVSNDMPLFNVNFLTFLQDVSGKLQAAQPKKKSNKRGKCIFICRYLH